MKQKLVLLTAAIVLVPAVFAASDPLVGTWRLERQEVNGSQTKGEPLTLRITQTGDKLAFAFSVPINNVYFVSMSYSVKLDGSEGDVKNANGDKIGTVEIKPSGPMQYTLTMKGANRPASSGKLIISPDGKTLTSETDAVQAGRSVHSKQFYSRY
ncbi:MAG TPA: hypothetical protein VME17_07830 [Bryobacteraceae bacterium]|nr:hypothetical protein [Bryobacteraceae bacterium]